METKSSQVASSYFSVVVPGALQGWEQVIAMANQKTGEGLRAVQRRQQTVARRRVLYFLSCLDGWSGCYKAGIL